MDLQTMISECRQIIGQIDSSNSNFTDAQMTIWANEFYRLACVKLESLPITERSYDSPAYQATPSITLNSGTVTINLVKFKDQTSSQWRPLKVIDLDELMTLDPNYENAAANIPTHLVKTGTFTARLYPPPNSANSGITAIMKTYGLEMPTDLSANTDTPDLPKNIHDLFPHYMAYKCFERLGDTQRSANELILSREGLKDMKNVTVNYSKGRGWRWPGSEGPIYPSLNFPLS